MIDTGTADIKPLNKIYKTLGIISFQKEAVCLKLLAKNE